MGSHTHISIYIIDTSRSNSWLARKKTIVSVDVFPIENHDMFSHVNHQSVVNGSIIQF